MAYEAATRATGKYTTVALAVPSSANVGDTVNFTVKGMLTATPYYWPNFAIGLAYIDGPANKVKIWVEGSEMEISKHALVYRVGEKLEYGATLTMTGRIKVDAPGTYVFKGVAGYYDEGKNSFYIDSEDEGKIEAKSPVITPPTTPPSVPGAPEIPWWPIAIAGAIVAIVGVIIAVAINEEEKEMMYMVMR